MDCEQGIFVLGSEEISGWSTCEGTMVSLWRTPVETLGMLVCLSDILPFIYRVEVFSMVDGYTLNLGAESDKTPLLVSVLCTCLFLP